MYSRREFTKKFARIFRKNATRSKKRPVPRYAQFTSHAESVCKNATRHFYVKTDDKSVNISYLRVGNEQLPELVCL